LIPFDGTARRVRVEGRVQGVGFRPFVYRLAIREGLTGWVLNAGGTVHLHIQGQSERVDAFLSALDTELPPLAEVHRIEVQSCDPSAELAFRIIESLPSDSGLHVIPPDQSMCPDCHRDFSDASNRRYRYPFTHCTQCGPRYTLIRHFPLDREHTAMASFALCPECLSEYEDPSDRRYHAQTQCCPACGPRLRFVSAQGRYSGDSDPLEAALGVLKSGGILAVRGVGGYHLMCDAGSDAAVERLRNRKQRPDKPLAVMISQGDLSSLPEAWHAPLLKASRPIILVPKLDGPEVVAAVAPRLAEVGIVLPDSPLHSLLAEDFHSPLVMTSANLSEEPILTAPDEAESWLEGIADGLLHHDREILRPADDSVYRSIAGKLRPIRLGRGETPLELRLRHPVEACTLALGGDLKNAVALAMGDRLILSPHVGTLSSAKSLDVLDRVIQDLSDLSGWIPERVICDGHPDYRSHVFASTFRLPMLSVPHHHAHASSLYGEMCVDGPVLVFAFDGLGMGPMGELWGGEVFLGLPGHWKRVASLRSLPLPGGDRATKEPWRLSLALAWAAGYDVPPFSERSDALRSGWEKGVPFAETSSMGRLFDAASSLIGVCHHQTYEGQAAMELEAISRAGAEPMKLPLMPEGGILSLDWRPLIPMLLDPNRDAAEKGSIFHATIAHAVIRIAGHFLTGDARTPVGLTGGVFQNQLLSSQIQSGLMASGARVLMPEKVPINDGGLAFGQIIEASALDRAKMQAFVSE
jgi:hydrogenase maturation protein HypF